MENPFSAPQPPPPELQEPEELVAIPEEIEEDCGIFEESPLEPAEPPTPKPQPLPTPVIQHPDASPTHHHQPAMAVPHQSPVGWSDADFDEHDGSELPSLTMEEKSCRMCRFFKFKGENRANTRFGECRRKAPEGVGKAQWPSVLWDSWCGEWEMGVDQSEMMQMARHVAEGVAVTNE